MWIEEESAHRIACPIFALAFFLTDNKLNDDACQGSRCAWWRWPVPPEQGVPSRYGYCGHAGRPEGDPP